MKTKDLDNKLALLEAEIATETAPHFNKVRAKLGSARRILAEAPEKAPEVVAASDTGEPAK